MPFGKRPSNLRTQYVDPSHHFLNWVNQLGFEKSALGRIAYVLDRRFGLRRILLLFLFALGLSFLMSWDFEVPGNYSVGISSISHVRKWIEAPCLFVQDPTFGQICLSIGD